MSNTKCQHKITAPDGTKLVAEVVADGSENVCAGCYFELENCIDLRLRNSDFECDSTTHGNMNGIIWIKIEKEQPVPKSDTIKEIRAKTKTLQDGIYKLVEAFETDTGMVVRGIDLTHVQEIGGNSETYGIELDVRLN